MDSTTKTRTETIGSDAKAKSKNQSRSLLKAKKQLDDVLVSLAGAPEFEEAKALREKVMKRYFEEEMKLPAMS